MALSAQRQSNNINRSVQFTIGDPTITVDGETYNVYPDWRWGDPDEAGSPATTPNRAFVTTTWLQSKAGRKGSSVLQVDVYSRIGSPDDPDGDPFGNRANDIADFIEDVFSGTEASGGLKACVRVLDFNLDPIAPVATDDTVWLRSIDGMLGESDSRTPAGTEGEMWRVSLTLRFWNSLDFRQTPYYG